MSDIVALFSSSLTGTGAFCLVITSRPAPLWFHDNDSFVLIATCGQLWWLGQGVPDWERLAELVRETSSRWVHAVSDLLVIEIDSRRTSGSGDSKLILYPETWKLVNITRQGMA